MLITFSAGVNPDTLKYEAFYNKYIKFNRTVIIDDIAISHQFDNKPINWAFAQIMKMDWLGEVILTDKEYVSQIVRSEDFCGLVSTTFLLMNQKHDKLIIVLTGDVTNVIPRDINVCYQGDLDTYKTYMDYLNINESEHYVLRKPFTPNQDRLCKEILKLNK